VHEPTKHLQVTGLVPDMPAIRSRVIRIGDVIQAINDEGIEKEKDFKQMSRKEVSPLCALSLSVTLNSVTLNSKP
jgi:C-terminal processing protease CtpA/Prc